MNNIKSPFIDYVFSWAFENPYKESEPKDVGVAGIMANKKNRKIIFECYSFNSILDYRKIGKFFTSVHFVSSEYESKCGNTIRFIQKLTFKESCCLLGSSLHEFEIYFG